MNQPFEYAPVQSPRFELLYRDDDVLVFSKPPGLLSVPGKAAAHKDSLAKRVKVVFPTATIVHRLDMATSGLMLMALNKPSHRALSRQFELRQVKKYYVARVIGHPASDGGVIDLPLCCDWPNRPKQMIHLLDGKPSHTLWTLQSIDSVSSLVRLTPITGRSHQLRVHMLSLGHPILGDRLYSNTSSIYQRLHLHAESLEFTHPVSQQPVRFFCPHPFANEDRFRSNNTGFSAAMSDNCKEQKV